MAECGRQPGATISLGQQHLRHDSFITLRLVRAFKGTLQALVSRL
jgi:hypothetical protein